MQYFNHLSGGCFRSGDAEIYFEEVGNSSKPVVLLLHGGFQNMEDLNSLIPLFENNYRIIGIDSRGHGKSTLGKEGLSYQRLEEDTISLLNHLNISNVNILGFSDGGIVGYRLATRKDIDVSKLITIGGTWNINDALLTEELFKRITPQSWKEKFPQSVIDYERLNPHPDFERFTFECKKMWLDVSETGYPNENVAKISCATLIVRGESDHLFARSSAVELADKIKGSLLLNVPFGGHITFQDQKEVVEIIIRQFL